MFEKFKELFSSENLLDAAFKTTVTMLEFDERMFHASRTSLRERDDAEVELDIKQTDRKINKYQREVRRNVLTHLSIAGTQNLVPGLVLLTIVIDVERIGDYTKNILDLAVRYPRRLDAGQHEGVIREIEEAITEAFPVVIESLKTQDKSAAREIMKREEHLGKASDGVVYDMMTAKDAPREPGTAVALAMYARYLKRINAHLTNVASSLVNPFPRIGFREKRQLQ